VLANQDQSLSPRQGENQGSKMPSLLVDFALQQPLRGPPSLGRGWRTPDPSPTRSMTALPKQLPGTHVLMWTPFLISSALPAFKTCMQLEPDWPPFAMVWPG